MTYTREDHSIHGEFYINDQLIRQQDNLLKASGSIVTHFPVKATGTGSLNTLFRLKTTTGFKDGEERKIPVYNTGSEEANGRFYPLAGDTSFSFSPVAGAGPVEVHAQNNTLDILLSELDHLKKYPYYCMEQTASKLKGLLLEQTIRQNLQQPFKGEKEIKALVKKIQDAQLYNGSWSWWEKGQESLPVTIYVMEALLPLRKDPLIASTIRNGLLFLQNQLLRADKTDRLQILACLSKAGHLMNYDQYLSGISFDSLSLHQQWQWVQLCQQQKIEHSKQLEQLINRQTGTITGGIYWGTETYRWYNNAMATTVLAYTVLEQERPSLLPGIIRYFLEQRTASYWTNTVESASVVAAILPRILMTIPSFQQPATIRIDGDSSWVIDRFPYTASLTANNPLNVRKTGGGLIYLTLYQKWWNTDPQPVTSPFTVETYFEKNNRQIATLTPGEKVKMKVKLNALKDAEYVMLEMPIPAGCTYSAKKQDDSPRMHTEYFKNRIVLFAEQLHKGAHIFEIELEPRYKGKYTLNPAKAELMYFPLFYGRNAIKQVVIE